MTTLNHTIKFTSANFGDATGISAHNLSTTEDVNTVTQTSITPALKMTVDATWLVDPLAGEQLEVRYVPGNLVSIDGVPTAAFTGKMVNCLSPNYKNGSIYSGTKAILSTWQTERKATGSDALLVRAGTVDVNIGFGATALEASATQQTVLAGASAIIDITGQVFIGYQGTVGTVVLEQGKGN